MKINYFNAEHVHTLIDLPTSKTIEEVVQLFKGSMSHRINEEKVLEEGLRGAEGTVPFRFRTQTYPESRNILLRQL